MPSLSLFSALWDQEVRVFAGLSEVKIQNRKGKVFPTAFDVDKVMEEVEDTGPAPVWQPKIAGWPDPVTPPPAKKGKRGAGAGEQKKIADRDSDFDFEHVARKEKGRRRRLELQSSSQPVPSAPASAGRTDRDLAGTQFPRNCVPNNIIEF